MNGQDQTSSRAARQFYAQGWHIFFRNEQIGPMSLHELSRRYNSGELSPADDVYHARIGRWVPLREVLRVLTLPDIHEGPAIDPAILRRLSQRSDIVVRNPVYLLATAMGAVLTLFAAISALNSRDGETVGVLMFIAGLYLAWWAWLEWRGIVISGNRLSFPARAPFWPGILPWRTASVELPSIQSAGFRSSGGHTHMLILKRPSKDATLVFDSALARDTILIMLSLRQIAIDKS
ncbi:MAG: DUF4339 domain-containing protein [Beijerinckiaceae bacterium]